MNSGRKNRWLIIALTGAAAAVLVFLAVVLVGVGIYNAPQNRLKRLLNLGDKYLTAQEYEQAIAVFNKAVEIDPKDPDIYLGLAEAYKGIGDMQAAYKALEGGYAQTENPGLFAVMQKITAAGDGGQAEGNPGTGQQTDGNLPGGTADGNLPDETTDGNLPGETTDGNLPDMGPAQESLSDGELILCFKWDGKSTGGSIANLSLGVQGTLDDGSEVSANERDAQATAQDGAAALEIETADTGTEKSIRIKFLRTDGAYHLTLEDEESMRLYGDQAGISRSEVRIYLITPEGETELKREDYLYRYPTGYWMLELDIDHGTVE